VWQTVTQMSESAPPADGPRESERMKAWEMLGFQPPLWSDESDAPPIDGQAASLLRAYSRHLLPEQVAFDVFTLTQTYRSWAEAATRIQLEQYWASYN